MRTTYVLNIFYIVLQNSFLIYNKIQASINCVPKATYTSYVQTTFINNFATDRTI